MRIYYEKSDGQFETSVYSFNYAWVNGSVLGIWLEISDECLSQASWPNAALIKSKSLLLIISDPSQVLAVEKKKESRGLEHLKTAVENWAKEEERSREKKRMNNEETERRKEEEERRRSVVVEERRRVGEETGGEEGEGEKEEEREQEEEFPVKRARKTGITLKL